MTPREMLHLSPRDGSNHYSVEAHGSSVKISDNHVYENENQGKQVASSSVSPYVLLSG